MVTKKSGLRPVVFALLLVVGSFLLLTRPPHMAMADVYTDSAHGNVTSGVNRSTAICENWPNGVCTTGDCAHCHDTFDDTTCGVYHRMLFSDHFTINGAVYNGLCMRCHGGDKQVGGIINYDYSRTRGGEESKDCPDSVRDAFRFVDWETLEPRLKCDSDHGSAHDLKDIRSYMKGKWGWGGTNAEVNPCATCHNPHKATKDFPCSLPSGHGNTWEIWGDESGEKMADYLNGGVQIYTPPYKVGDGTERDAATQPDYNTLCLECHQYEQNSQQHGTVRAINWDVEKHGKGAPNFDYPFYLKPPYPETYYTDNYVLCCTDCHEPHGSRNPWLTRTEVNGTPGINIDTDPIVDVDFCRACHLSENRHGPSLVYCWRGGCHGHGLIF
jgi:hypothetical protein